MSKIFSLYKNELIKIKKKKSILILFILMIVGVIAIGALFKVSNLNVAMNSSSTWDGTQIEQELENYTKTNDKLNQQLATANTEEEKTQIQYEIDTNQIMITTLDLAKEKKIPIYSETDYLSQIINDIQTYKKIIVDTNYNITTDISNLAFYQESVDKLTAILDSKDYSAYLEIKKQEIQNSTVYTAEEKEIEVKALELLGKANPSGKTVNNVTSAVENWKNIKKSLLYGIDYFSSTQQNTILSADKIEEYTNKLSVLEYKLDNAYYNNDAVSDYAFTAMKSVGMVIVVILVIILAGGAFSQEISSGSIKSLIISPTKRWKIFTAKFFSILAVGIVSVIITTIVAILAYLALYGSDTIVPYVYAANGSTHTINYFLYQLLSAFVDFIDVFVFMALAFMLSIITRNTAASVGISMAVYFVGSPAYEILTMFFSGKWIDFIPFSNLSLGTKIFPYSSLGEMDLGETVVTSGNTSLTFSILYLIILVICMLWIAHDSFTKKDL